MDGLSTTEREYLEKVSNCGQANVIAKLDTTEKLRNFIADLQYFESFYPGGLESYVTKGRELLMKSSRKENPMEGYVPSVPDTVDVSFNTVDYHNLEKVGVQELMYSGFVLVAGGLGERLGFNGIKVSLPTEILTELSFLGFYIKKILALQHRLPLQDKHLIPFAIMTSDNNHDLTLKYLNDHDYYGMRREQVFLMKQDVIPALTNIQCELAVAEDGHLIKKPHGHGDVHLCLYRDKIAQKWYDEYHVRRLFFFQDTNALALFTMACTAAICKKQHPHMTSTCVKRLPHEASGALCKLTNRDGEELVCNVEYNQLENVLRVIDSRGDFADASGYSPFPGNGNILSFDLYQYLQVLNASKGVIPEFVNPKYRPGSMTEYLQPTRLESMMQDYPKLMRQYQDSLKIENSHLVITYPREIAWSPVKNSLARGHELEKKTGHAESAASGEHDLLNTYRLLMVSVNSCPVCNPSNTKRVIVEEGAYVIFGPEAGCTTEEIHSHIGSDIVLKKGSVLIVNCRNWYLDKVTVDGTLILEDDSGEEIQTARIELHNCIVQNRGWSYKTIDPADSSYSPIYQMRGFIVEKSEAYTLHCGKSGDCIIYHYSCSDKIEKEAVCLNCNYRLNTEQVLVSC